MEENQKIAGEEIQKFGVMFIRMLHLGIANIRLYPSGSEIVKHTVWKIHEALIDYLNTHESLTLSESRGNFLIEGKEMDAKGIGQTIAVDFVLQISELGIKSIEFQRGLTIEEVENFLAGMSKRKQDLQEKGGFAKYIEEKGVRNIKINEVVYVALTKEEESLRLPEFKIEEDVEGLLKTTEEGAEAISSLPDKISQRESLSSLVRKIAGLRPDLLMEFLEKPMPPKAKLLGIKEELLKAFSEPKIEGIFERVAGWYQEITSRVPPSPDAEQQIERLRQFVDIILAAPEARSVPPYVFERLIKAGVLEKFPPWVPKEVEKEEVILDKTLQGEARIVLEPGIREKIPDLIRGLCISNQDVTVRDILKKINENLKASSSQIRAGTAKLLEEAIDVILTSQKDELLSDTIPLILAGIKGENDIETFSALARVLKRQVIHLLMKGQYDYAAQTTAVFRKHASPKEGMSVDKRQVLEKTLGEIANESIPVLISDIRSGDAVRQSKVVPMLRELAEAVIAPLIETIKEFDDFRTRKMCATILRGIGEKARTQVIHDLRTNLSVQSLRRLIGVLDEIGGEEMLEYLGDLIHHQDSSIRLEVAKLLMKTGTPSAEKILLELLIKESESAVLSEVMRFFGKMKIAGAVEALLKHLKSRNEDIVKEACAALGEIGDERAIIPLGRVINPGFMGKKMSQQTRTSAMLALRKFKGEEVNGIFTRALKDKNPVVQKIARESLAK